MTSKSGAYFPKSSLVSAIVSIVTAEMTTFIFLGNAVRVARHWGLFQMEHVLLSRYIQNLFLRQRPTQHHQDVTSFYVK